MGSRYFLTGVELGMLHAFFECGKEKEGLKLLKEIEDKQFIGNIPQEDRERLEVGIIEKGDKKPPPICVFEPGEGNMANPWADSRILNKEEHQPQWWRKAWYWIKSRTIYPIGRLFGSERK